MQFAHTHLMWPTAELIEFFGACTERKEREIDFANAIFRFAIATSSTEREREIERRVGHKSSSERLPLNGHTHTADRVHLNLECEFFANLSLARARAQMKLIECE